MSLKLLHQLHFRASLSRTISLGMSLIQGRSSSSPTPSQRTSSLRGPVDRALDLHFFGKRGSQLCNAVPLSKVWGMSSKSLKCDVRLPLHSIPLYRTPTIRGLVQSMLYNLGIRRCMRTDKMLALSLPCLILDRSLSAMQSPLFGFSEEFLDMWTWCYSKSMKALQYLHTCVNTPVTKSGRRSIVETERVQSHGHCLQGGGFGFAIRLLRIVRDTLESKEQYCTRMVWMLLLGCWPQGK